MLSSWPIVVVKIFPVPFKLDNNRMLPNLICSHSGLAAEILVTLHYLLKLQDCIKSQGFEMYTKNVIP